MERLTKRSQYLEVARGARTPRRGFLLQTAPRKAGPDEPASARFGFTVTKKIGNAVERNRIRRRLKEAVRLHGALAAKPGTDYVLVGRRAALTQPFADLAADVVGAIESAARPRAGSDDHRSRREQKRPHHG
ncbi:ribonuclease P protein component [Chthonobacter rhizosphaerae]|uniref:ribonuclease P protein component n=1 Tax=Chthonobacter rhizosphaerae TaxID=2735553 RepID=UPI001FE3EDD5|nr:ribonuclease P protein component [Chthonobacter rhizosphaerae]